MLLPIIIFVFLLMTVLELITGFAIVGWPGNNKVISRAEVPGQYWLLVATHSLFGIGLPILLIVAFR